MSVGKESISQVRELLRELMLGREDPDGCFCLCLSLLGDTDTRTHFLDMIEPLSSGHEHLHSQLTATFLEYFSKDEADELELALTLSLNETKHIKTDFRQQNSVHEPHMPLCNKSYAEMTTGSSGGDQPKVNQPITKWTLDTEVHKTTCAIKNINKDNDDLKVTKSKRSQRRLRKKELLLKNPSGPRPVLLWLRRDLRIWDNPALIGCLELGAPVIPVFLWNAVEEEGPGVTVASGGASKYWLHQALVSLNLSLEQLGSHLVTLKGEPSSLTALQGLIAETGAASVVATALYEPWLKERDDSVWETLEKQGVNCHIYHSYCLRDPYAVTTRGVGLRGIGSVSHFMSCCQQNPGSGLGAPLDAPGALPAPSTWPQGCPLVDLELARIPRRKDGTEIDWAVNIRKSWDFSEKGAQAHLEAFLRDGVYRYEKESSRADAPNTSSISPYLHFGQLSARHLLWDARGARCRSPKFQRKLSWRDLAYWQLCLFPDLPWESIRPPYKVLRWSSDRAHLKAWQRGFTGYPLVDAAMRQLWQTGWMNNYMRHVVASFLIAYLHFPWQEGYRWFQDTLLDADVAIDAMMWQNGGMCGLDHWNFVMHPVDAALTCDPYGTYVRQWCPELKALPDDLIHKPWKCPASMLRRAGVVLGGNYPERVVTNLEERRAQSLQDVASVRRRFRQFIDQRSGCDLVPLPARLVQEALGSMEDVVRHEGNGFLLPVITRMEFKHHSEDPDRQDNPYNAVLKGYVSRKRDETIAFFNERDFTASVMCETAQRRERLERDCCLLEGLPQPTASRGRARRTPTRDPYSKVPGGVPIPHR
ncbi:deoxyribodipyrimidine photo-lyase [Pimephales promelas]|uniref:deoxyribodipyrimidine photo-lyase n=1 Tax=Pimephales promelas TaxID=90988 RepID=UPI0019558458|nr:deoxyribodipyrimidine photo-lyase [Pimephales promelas]XP_039510235.1 deoxyribodipyrimidine photo-lyase [Pimephales promelas]KAG1935023.1 cryptochrome-1-like [Pimephales promelas]